MDSNPSSPTQESNEMKAEFRKITNDTANRKYRRHSPVSGSSGEDGSPKRDHSSRAKNERRNNDKVDDGRSSRSQHGRGSDSYRHSSRGDRHDDYSRYGKHADEDDRSLAKASVRSGRESREGTNSDYRDRESDYNRTRDRYRDVDRYARGRSDRTRYDGRRGDRFDDRDRHSRDRDYHHDEKREYRSSRGHSSKKETSDMKDLEGSKVNQEKSNSEGLDRLEDRHVRARGRSEDRSAFVSEASKRTKFSLGSDDKKDERQSSGSKQSEDFAAKVSPEQGIVSGDESATSVDAAKVAAIKAAQLVNQNLTSTGFMTADQKKKLLWGNKKSHTAEEPSHHWDTSLFSDRERQEKFNKLMSLRLPWYIWPIVGCERRSEGGHGTSEQSRCREAERAASAGSREAIHCWAPTKRWSHCRVRSLKSYFGVCLTAETLFSQLICFVCMRILLSVVFYCLKVMRILGFYKLFHIAFLCLLIASSVNQCCSFQICASLADCLDPKVVDNDFALEFGLLQSKLILISH
ncbi:arginine/serine-rich coiled-coil protein 2-like isoform X2 [Chenopodium quinoa]|uniref:arginine/serine-rich coiled-coil protein 2-like isoform X2 n=1 Tax=Chenopodium quinoa TaxID=63459 RepID=UPI000B76FB0D|nr:arginine/serine-rich coiled-coil protein 2-like isoform X2 [Chenopodium quinoa]